MSYQILRTAKLTSFGEIGGSGSHTFRERKTSNADSKMTPQNEFYGASRSVDLIYAYKERLSKVKTVRKNAVLGIEYMITFSPDFADRRSQDEYFKDAQKWLETKHGKDNVLSVSIHRDEKTPHIVAYVVPIDAAGKLNAREYLGGKKVLSDMQTDFHLKVSEKFGLERGVLGSTAKHIPIKKFYGNLSAPIPEIKTIVPEIPDLSLFQRTQLSLGFDTSEHLDAVAKAAKAELARAAEIKQRDQVLADKAKQYDLEKRNRDALTSELERVKADNKALSSRLRDLPLDQVLTALGATQDPADKNNFKTEQGRITVTGTKFYNHDLSKGSGGAIDLTMHLLNCKYPEAIKTLSEHFGADAVASAVAAKSMRVVNAIAKDDTVKPASSLPDDCGHNWSAVKKWLMESRHIPSKIIDYLRDKRLIRADDRGNAIFVNQNCTGGEIRGKGANFKGYRGKRGLFVIDRLTDKTLLVVESGTDAMALLAMQPNRYGKVVSTGGDFGKETIKELKALQAAGYTVFVGTDNDKSGHDKFVKLAQELELTHKYRVTPVGRDWQEDLAEQVKLGFGGVGFKPAPTSDDDYSRPVF